MLYALTIILNLRKYQEFKSQRGNEVCINTAQSI